MANCLLIYMYITWNKVLTIWPFHMSGVQVDKQTKIRIEGGDHKFTTSLSNSLARVISSLRRHSGFRRLLWMDQICINQEDNDERKDFQFRMLEIATILPDEHCCKQ